MLTQLQKNQSFHLDYHFLIFLLICLMFNCQNNPPKSATSKGNAISISGAFALYPLTIKWAEEFNKIYPEVRIDISAGGAGKGMTDALAGIVDLGMFSRAITAAEKERGVWYIAVTKDAVLPTISAKNPVLEQLKAKGLCKEDFHNIFILGTLTEWGVAIRGEGRANIHVYTRSDACGAAGTWAEYLGGVQENLKGIGIFGDPGLADAVKKDPLGIGYNNTVYVYNQVTKQKYNGLEVVPIDINENGEIDADESFYDNMDQIIEAIGTAKYPSPPARELYFVAKKKPTSEIVITFLRWILQDGQKFVIQTGYVPLKTSRITEELTKLVGN
jgi:phosphate transport system substrate-binding protein